MVDSENTLKPVKGKVVSRSIRKTMETVLLSLMTFCIGCFCVLWCLVDQIRGPQSSTHQVTCWGLIFGFIAIVCGPVLAVSSLLRLLSRERLILGKDGLQMVRRQRGNDVVFLQILYANVVECSYEKHNDVGRIGINLASLDDKQIYAPGVDLNSNKSNSGWHYIIEGGYSTGLIDIHKQLVKLLKLATNEI